MSQSVMLVLLFIGAAAVLVGLWALFYFVITKKATFLRHPKVQSVAFKVLGPSFLFLSLLGVNTSRHGGKNPLAEWWNTFLMHYPQFETAYRVVLIATGITFLTAFIVRIFPDKQKVKAPWSTQSKIAMALLGLFVVGMVAFVIVVSN